MSKAFTKEDDDAGFTLARSPRRAPLGPITPTGARHASERLADVSARLKRSTRLEEQAPLESDRRRLAALAAAVVMPAPLDREVVAFGAEVLTRDSRGRERIVVVTSPDEIGLVPHAASVTSPLSRALLGARPGDAVEVEGPRGIEELTVIAVRYPD